MRAAGGRMRACARCAIKALEFIRVTSALESESFENIERGGNVKNAYIELICSRYHIVSEILLVDRHRNAHWR